MDSGKILSGKTAIVTGGGTGMGRAIALAFGAAGANVVICGRRLEPCEETIAELTREEGQGIAVKCDVSSPEDITRLVETAMSRFGRIDILVNNAAVAGGSKPFLKLSLSEWEQTMAINLTSIFLLSQMVARHMVGTGGGKIINITSILASKVSLNASDYCASKGGVLQLTRAMALELARDNIQVNAIAPGYFSTDFAPDLPLTKEDEYAWAKKARIPARRLGEPSEVAPLAVLLASGASNYTVGSSFGVDGGVLLS